MRAIITFHSIDASGSVLSYPAERLDAFLLALSRCRLPVVDLETLLNSRDDGVVLTFDDGMRSVYTDALPILTRHASRAHLFLTTGYVGKTNDWPSQPKGAPKFDMMRWSEIEAWAAAGMFVENHTQTHPNLVQTPTTLVEDECHAADEIIAKRIGRRPRFFAYPYGARDQRIVSCLRNRYRASMTDEMRALSTLDDAAELPRLESYYLQSPWASRDLRSAQSRCYLAVRRLLRQAKRAAMRPH